MRAYRDAGERDASVGQRERCGGFPNRKRRAGRAPGRRSRRRTARRRGPRRRRRRLPRLRAHYRRRWRGCCSSAAKGKGNEDRGTPAAASSAKVVAAGAGRRRGRPSASRRGMSSRKGRTSARHRGARVGASDRLVLFRTGLVNDRAAAASSRRARKGRRIARLIERAPRLPPKTRRLMRAAFGEVRSRRTPAARGSRDKADPPSRSFAAADGTHTASARGASHRFVAPGSGSAPSASWDPEQPGGEHGRTRGVAARSDDETGRCARNQPQQRTTASAAAAEATIRADSFAPLRPAIGSVRRGKPASGTRRVSSPRVPPTKRIRALGCRRRSSLATAIAGKRCPPVPPAANTM
jgi:hypothetical protein